MIHAMLLTRATRHFSMHSNHAHPGNPMQLFMPTPAAHPCYRPCARTYRVTQQQSPKRLLNTIVDKLSAGNTLDFSAQPDASVMSAGIDCTSSSLLRTAPSNHCMMSRPGKIGQPFADDEVSCSVKHAAGVAPTGN
jgi:hypothetical protein